MQLQLSASFNRCPSSVVLEHPHGLHPHVQAGPSASTRAGSSARSDEGLKAVVAAYEAKQVGRFVGKGLTCLCATILLATVVVALCVAAETQCRRGC